jgi:hypothetical protein
MHKAGLAEREQALLLRGLIPWPAEARNPIGPDVKYAVRSLACSDCRAWHEALKGAAEVAREAGLHVGSDLDISEHISPSAEHATGGRCGACMRERAWYGKRTWPEPRSVVALFVEMKVAKQAERG